MPFINQQLWMGSGTHVISPKLYSLNRARLVERLQVKDVPFGSIVLLQGGQDISLYDTDIYHDFKQESYFRWAFGVIEPFCYGAIEVDSGRSHLFIPRFPEDYVIWMGPLHSLEDFQNKYMVDTVNYIDQMDTVLKELFPSVVLVLKGINTDSGLESQSIYFEGIEEFQINNDILYPEISELRVIKTDCEIEVLSYVCDISSAAHRRVMQLISPGIHEYQCEAEFLYYIYSIGGCRYPAYSSTCASGFTSAYLHYGNAAAPNDKIINNGDICLLDMGASYFGYSIDMACTFPANKKFTSDQKLIYEAVLKANTAVMKEARPGVSWACMHILANRMLLSSLKDGGILQGDISVMVTAGLGAIFQPHGVGHLVGLDVHDVGGYLPETPPRLKHPKGIEKLRTSRILKKGMVLTVAPGCYFINSLLDHAINDPILSQFLVMDVIDRFRGFGGVRIGDVVVVTEMGVKNLVDVPRTVEEIEQFMQDVNSESE